MQERNSFSGLSANCPYRAREGERQTANRDPNRFFKMRDLPYLNIGIRDIKNGGEIRVYMERRLFTQYQTRTQGRDSSNLISLSVPSTNNYFYDLSLFYPFLHKIVRLFFSFSITCSSVLWSLGTFYLSSFVICCSFFSVVVIYCNVVETS